MKNRKKGKKVVLMFLSVLIASSMFFTSLKAAGTMMSIPTESTIQEVFSDPNFAQAVADSVSSGDVNAILTQEMVDGLSYLFADNREISDLTGVSHLTSLNMLVLNNNQISSLPKEIGNLTSLSFLNLNNNQISELPPEIANLDNLSVLSVSKNYLTSLPDEIGNLTSLRSLDVSMNQLTSFPESLLNIVNMFSFLGLEGNLLPSDYEVIILQNGNSHGHQNQDKLILDATASAVVINNILDLDTIDYSSLVQLESGNELSPSHIYELQNYVDENMQPININDYFFSNGVVKKDGKVYAQVRATGTGVFTNSSDNALTDGYIEIIFKVINYKLSFDLNGGTGPIPNVQLMIEGTLATVIDQPVRDGYSFKEWNTQADGSGVTWDFMATTMPASDVTLYAQWEVNQYELVFDTNDDTRSIWATQQVAFGSLAQEPTDPSRIEHIFNGWNTQADGQGTTWDFMSTTMPANNVTLYAQWETTPVQTYVLSFDLNGANGLVPASQILTSGVLATTVAEPQREGYVFSGWNTQADGQGTTWDFIETTMPTNNVTLYAQWEATSVQTYVLSFDLNGASGLVPASQILTNGVLATTVAVPQRDGYVFSGWNTQADGQGTTWDFIETTMPTNNVTLYAQWQQNKLPETGLSSQVMLFGLVMIPAGLLLLIRKKQD